MHTAKRKMRYGNESESRSFVCACALNRMLKLTLMRREEKSFSIQESDQRTHKKITHADIHTK